MIDNVKCRFSQVRVGSILAQGNDEICGMAVGMPTKCNGLADKSNCPFWKTKK